MNILRIFQRLKWEILTKSNPNYYVSSDEGLVDLLKK